MAKALKMEEQPQYEVMKRDTGSCKFIKFVIRIFKRKPKIVNLNGTDEIPQGAIFIANHSAASGPMTYRTFLTPPPMMIWGMHEMCENYRKRRRYLIDVFYGQKLGFGKIRAWLSGTLFAIISGWVYRAGGVIPVYYDNRTKRTFTHSLKCLEENVSVLVFPENSSAGYSDQIEKPFHSGYLTLARMATRHFGEERPIYCIHYSRKRNCIVIGTPMYVSELAKTMHKDEINDHFRIYTNGLAAHYPA